MNQLSQFIVADSPSVANHFMAEIRDVTIQTDRMRFRRNIERIGEILAYELSKTLSYEQKSVTTPLEDSTVSLLAKQPVLVSVLRAGLPLHQGVLNYFDQAESGFVGAYRDHEDHHPEEFSIQLDYQSIPDIQDRPLILIDPMLATGQTLTKVLQEITAYNSPSQIHILSAIAAPEGVAFLQEKADCSYHLWLGAIDRQLNAKAYIVPGLGDAGDLAFGKKQ